MRSNSMAGSPREILAEAARLALDDLHLPAVHRTGAPDHPEPCRSPVTPRCRWTARYRTSSGSRSRRAAVDVGLKRFVGSHVVPHRVGLVSFIRASHTNNPGSGCGPQGSLDFEQLGLHGHRGPVPVKIAAAHARHRSLPSRGARPQGLSADGGERDRHECFRVMVAGFRGCYRSADLLVG